MFDVALTGVEADKAVRLLSERGVPDVEIIHNDSRNNADYDCELVVSADVCDNHAALIVSKFRVEVGKEE